MRADHPPLRHTLPELPDGCEELQATADPDSDTCLRAHLDCLPGLGIERASLLSRVAVEPSSSAPEDGTMDSQDPVLGLDDLLRTNPKGFHALHPRVQQVVTLGALDSLLETVGTRLDKRLDFSAYQYPQYLFECRGSAPDGTALYPPAYHINVIDVLRELRANNILTTVCRPGESLPSSEMIRAALDSMTQRGEYSTGVFTLLLDDNRPVPVPTLAFHDAVVPGGCPGQTQLFELVSHLGDQCQVDLAVCTVSQLPPEVCDD